MENINASRHNQHIVYDLLCAAEATIFLFLMPKFLNEIPTALDESLLESIYIHRLQKELSLAQSKADSRRMYTSLPHI